MLSKAIQNDISIKEFNNDLNTKVFIFLYAKVLVLFL